MSKLDELFEEEMQNYAIEVSKRSRCATWTEKIDAWKKEAMSYYKENRIKEFKIWMENFTYNIECADGETIRVLRFDERVDTEEELKYFKAWCEETGRIFYKLDEAKFGGNEKEYFIIAAKGVKNEEFFKPENLGSSSSKYEIKNLDDATLFVIEVDQEPSLYDLCDNPNCDEN